MANDMRQSDQSATNREDRINVITLIAKHETPFLNKAKKTTATNGQHNWQTDTMDAPDKDNSAIGGASVTFTDADWKVRPNLYNNTQIMFKKVSVSYEQDWTDKPQLGRGERTEYNYQEAKKTKELARNNEAALLSDNDRVAPTASAAGKMRGISKWIETNSMDAAVILKNNPILSQALFESAFARTYMKGGNPRLVMCNVYQKMRIARFVTPAGRTIGETGTKLVNVVNQVETVGGMADIVLNPIMDADKVFFLDMDYWYVAFFMPLYKEILGKTGRKTEGYVENTLTLEARNEQSSAQIKNLSFENYGTIA
mgnify:CR=1 FL=1